MNLHVAQPFRAILATFSGYRPQAQPKRKRTVEFPEMLHVRHYLELRSGVGDANCLACSCRGCATFRAKQTRTEVAQREHRADNPEAWRGYALGAVPTLSSVSGVA